MKNLVTGGAGFIGSHIIERLICLGEDVICIDNFKTSSLKNIQKWISHPNFKLIKHNIVEPIDIKVNRIWHLACPASPPHYKHDPINTLDVSFNGSKNMLNLAKNINQLFY